MAKHSEEVKNTGLIASTAEQELIAANELDFGEDAGKGMENLTMDEYRIPFLRILDPKSPQCAPEPHGLGATAGSLFNTATSQIYDGKKGFDFVPCYREHNFVEWIKRNEDGSGGGFVAVHEPDSPFVLQILATNKRFGQLPVPGTDHVLGEGFYLYCIMIDPEGNESRVILGFTGMQIKKYHSFINRYDNIKYQTSKGIQRPPLWAHKWHATTVYETRATQSWYGWAITLSGKKLDGKEDIPRASLLKPADPLYVAGKEFYGLITGGKTKTDFSATASERVPDDEELPM